MAKILSYIWKHIHGKIQCYIIWIFHSKFNIGSSVIISNFEGEILLGKHVFSSKKTPWRLIGGYISKGENIYNGAKREVKEELNIDIEIDRILIIRSGFLNRIEIILVSKPILKETVFKIDLKELEKVEWFKIGSEPIDTLNDHKNILNIYKKNINNKVEIMNF